MTDSLSPWLQFLNERGARYGDDGEVLDFGGEITRETLARGFVTPLTDLGLIEADGEDAARFLHAQLTHDVEHLESGQARRAGYCSAKGRLLATFLIWRSEDKIVLQLPRALQPAIQKRLQMFVLRAKVKLRDAASERVALGLGGDAATAALAQVFTRVPDALMKTTDSGAGTLIRLPDAFGAPRYLLVGEPDRLRQMWPALTEQLYPSPTSVWRLADIEAGIPQVLAATQEQFVPQMINLELIDGVSFKKGCYPGQEIVARTQYLGKVKRRALRASVDTSAVKPGVEVYSSADPQQPCGMIINAAPQPEGGSALLVEIKTAATEAGTVHLGSAAGEVLRFSPLPYALA